VERADPKDADPQVHQGITVAAQILTMHYRHEADVSWPTGTLPLDHQSSHPVLCCTYVMLYDCSAAAFPSHKANDDDPNTAAHDFIAVKTSTTPSCFHKRVSERRCDYFYTACRTRGCRAQSVAGTR
jgi:hypothetical protein